MTQPHKAENKFPTLLGHNTPDWHIMNSCPACTFKVCTASEVSCY